MNAAMDIAWIATAVWLAVTAAAVVCAVWLIVRFIRSERTERQVLEERLARGEITVDDYRARVALLSRQARRV